MKYARAMLALFLLGGAAAAAPAPGTPGVQDARAACNACKGAGRLELVPPDLGQYKGSIEPKSHWNVRLACPVCGGKGKVMTYRTVMAPLEDGTPPCTGCGWTGVERCRACSGTGVARCKAPGCKGGWIVTKYSTSTSRHAGSSHQRVKVTPCPECQGLGKVVCTACDGRRGTICRKCNGLGRGKDRKTP